MNNYEYFPVENNLLSNDLIELIIKFTGHGHYIKTTVEHATNVKLGNITRYLIPLFDLRKMFSNKKTKYDEVIVFCLTQHIDYHHVPKTYTDVKNLVYALATLEKYNMTNEEIYKTIYNRLF